MDKAKAKREMERIAAEYRDKPYEFWVAMIGGDQITFDFTAEDGQWYQVEIQAIWDDKEGGNVRALFCIDDGGWRAFFPLGHDFIMAPDGTFVGE